MSLADIKREHVVQAIAEHRQLGEEAFLRKYGFGRSTGWWVEHDGERYAPKALLGAAHGFATGTPLNSRGFHGGPEANTCLAKLGFSIVGQLLLDRASVESARGIVEALVPDSDRRKLALSLFAEAIAVVDSTKWSATLDKNSATLNIGNNRIVGLERRHLWLTVRTAPPGVPAEYLGSGFTSLPGSSVVRIPWEQVTRLAPACRDALLASARESAAYYQRINGATARSHSPGLVEYLKQTTGVQFDAPTLPAVVTASRPASSTNSLGKLLQDGGSRSRRNSSRATCSR